MNGKEAIPLAISIGLLLGTYIYGFTFASSLSLAIISFVISTTLVSWKRRLAAGIFGLSLAFLLNILPFKYFLEYAHLDIILFLLGMMVVVGYLEEVNYFEYLVSKLIPKLHGKPKTFYTVLIIITAIFAAIVDEVTAILFTSVIMLELASIYKVEPRKFLLPITYAVIIGGTATVMGDPVAILVAFNGGLSMYDFLIWATPITSLTVVMLILYTFLFLRNDLKALEEKMLAVDPEEIVGILTSEAKNPKKATLLFLSVLIPIMVHGEIANILNMVGIEVEPKTILISIALMGASYVIASEGDFGLRIFLHRVDWQTLFFLMAFFSLVGSLESVGVLENITLYMVDIAGGSDSTLYLLISFLTAVLSPIMDNVLTVATISPVVKELGTLGYNTYPIWFGILFSGVFAAIATPIGTSASLVMMGLLEKRRIKPVNLSEWLKMGLPLAIFTTGVALMIIYIRAFLI